MVMMVISCYFMFNHIISLTMIQPPEKKKHLGELPHNRPMDHWEALKRNHKKNDRSMTEDPEPFHSASLKKRSWRLSFCVPGQNQRLNPPMEGV